MSNISVLTSYMRPDVIGRTTIESLFSTIASEENPNKALILQARQDIPNKNIYKDKMRCVCPHGIFKERGEAKCFQEFSGHIFIDLDEKDIKDVVARKVVVASIEFVRAVWTTTSGKGLGILIAVENLNVSNFKTTMNAIHNYFKGIGLPPDPKLKSISCKSVIPYDPEIIVKNEYKKFQAAEKGIIHSEYEKKEKHITPDDTFHSHEHFIETACRLAGEQVIKKTRLVFKTQEDFTDGANFHVYQDGRMWDYIYIPQFIPDGRRHHIITAIAIHLMKLNPDVTTEAFTACLSSINKRCRPPLAYKEILSIVTWCLEMKRLNCIDVESGTKYIVFNDRMGRQTKVKQQIAGHVMGKIRKTRTLRMLKEAYNILATELNRKPTQKDLALRTGKGIATVKRYWNGIV